MHSINPVDTIESGNDLYRLALVLNHLAINNFAALAQLHLAVDRDLAGIDDLLGKGATVAQSLYLEEVIQSYIRLAIEFELLH
jgi:hypothetical protein